MSRVTATLIHKNVDGVWQSEERVTLSRIGLARTFLEPGREYKCQEPSTELGPDGKVKFETWSLSRIKGRVCFEEKYPNDKETPETLLKLAVEAGAVAFVAVRQFTYAQDAIHDIPVFVLEGKEATVYSTDTIRIQVKDNDKEVATKNDDDVAFTDFVEGKGISDPVIEHLELCGVQTVKDALCLLLDEKERMHQRMLAEEAAQEKARVEREQQEEAPCVLFPTNFSLANIGVGGLGADFEFVFRRLFTSRMFSPKKLAMLGISHVRGLLLVGPPGCGKTLLARQVCKLLKTRKTTIISGPEVFSKWIGQSEEHVRNLFKDAEAEWREKGERSGLHVIIIDEIDAMCGRRTSGTSEDGSGERAMNSVVNQLLAKMDGFERINNVLLIGMTNRKDAIDPALLRPGRFELEFKIDLPDEKGRLEILDIHTKTMRDGGLFDKESASSILSEIAAVTESFTGAEMESIVRGASVFAMDRCIDTSDLSLPPDEEKLKIEPSDFHRALDLVKKSRSKAP